MLNDGTRVGEDFYGGPGGGRLSVQPGNGGSGLRPTPSNVADQLVRQHAGNLVTARQAMQSAGYDPDNILD
jgi:hypothetical protein